MPHDDHHQSDDVDHDRSTAVYYRTCDHAAHLGAVGHHHATLERHRHINPADGSFSDDGWHHHYDLPTSALPGADGSSTPGPPGPGHAIHFSCYVTAALELHIAWCPLERYTRSLGLSFN